ncbi:hypothetical protein FIBSPDRAFT_955312 [Athelia psychrophila]|uniref:Uncharacterized protein n=1 Tax=Athelia psychrophila TaxID=1759441 RepID=A0A166IBY9_9AGAM|nr:hypothetical protein FIBSPDRAFT_955312 [Fibularhizoctonia sp. CBS 109695]
MSMLLMPLFYFDICKYAIANCRGSIHSICGGQIRVFIGHTYYEIKVILELVRVSLSNMAGAVWEPPQREGVIMKEQQIKNMKLEEDTNVFLQQMTELLQMAAKNEGVEMSNVLNMLDMILKGSGRIHCIWVHLDQA